jgi:predicted nucleotidyltransferase
MVIEMEMETRLRRFFQENHKNVDLAYLFGSYAKGKVNRLSDVDVAVLLSGKIDPEVYFDVQLDFAGELSSYLGKEVEVVILNRADPRLCYQVIKYGGIVFEKTRDFKADFEAKALSTYFDLKPMFEFYEKKLLERIKEGRFGKTYGGSRNSLREIGRISEKSKGARENREG